jgi:hypothetical protein
MQPLPSRPTTVPQQTQTVNEIIFLIEGASEGGFTARALGESIFTAADTRDELRLNIREAVDCHFENGQGPKLVGVQALACRRQPEG